MTADSPLYAHAQVLSVLPLFDERTARDIGLRYADVLYEGAGAGADSALATLRTYGLITETLDVSRIVEPLRDELKRELARDNPAIYRQVASTYAAYARNGLGDELTRLLGTRGARLNVAVMSAVAADESSAYDDLLGLLSKRSLSQGADVLATIRLLRNQPGSSLRDRNLTFLAGFQLWQTSDRTKAVVEFERILHEPMTDRAAGIAGHLTGVERAERGDLESALPFLQQAVSVLRDLHDYPGLRVTLTSLGRVQRDLAAKQARLAENNDDAQAADSLYDDAFASFDEAVEIGREHEGATVVPPLVEIALAYERLGHLDLAIDVAEQATAGESGGTSSEKSKAWTVLGSLYKQRGDLDSAARALDEAIRLAMLSNSENMDLARALNVLASNERRNRATLDRAILHSETSVRIGRLFRKDRHLSHALLTLAQALLTRASETDIQRALDALDEAERLNRRFRDVRGLEMIDRTRERFHHILETQASGH
jgi:tetratricopeptide (TPR) repeat protein